MHQGNFDLSIEEISKIEGQAGLDIKVRSGKIESLKFKIADYKRFYTKAVEGKLAQAVPQQVARICGTCSNAHLLCSIKTIENATKTAPSKQTNKLRELLNHGLIIRDHALHLYVFVLPNLLGKDSILDFDENNKEEHELLHDTFDIKEAGNLLSIWAGGRSVHAPYATLGGFIKLPMDQTHKIVAHLEKIRPRILKLIKIFAADKTNVEEDVVFVALNDPKFNYLSGDIITSQGGKIAPNELFSHLTHVTIPYSQASAYLIGEKKVMVGALARLNLNKDSLHPKTKKDASTELGLFPSNNIFHNNLAQAIEILHSIDTALDLLNNIQITQEKPVVINNKAGIGTGVIEAPRGLLFHQYEITEDGKVQSAKIVVPTGLNQILIEQSLKTYLETKLDLSKDKIALEAEKLIRAYDPCISCASHFLRLKWL
ncbi:hypothetical protein COW99_06130 [Candidatus Roizmanbacteria bacterium CG22_combo_CG10-13_8_21_14_all_38_20]|uniref:Ni/Fe hydrogenase subunit alpha n=1 Tax=Candidatus Roizmanbacteria bacterium CG22_combo_CG10-13_8_21_14_all_38_20 TaxID=1974862 RepID=A0A2H0BU75_9BACT|nr:hypothetical protein [Candidatus Microgenomates bacterium]PIP61069.1 MAG: hypothetical protein COW99_06130 [Candidatus Roizmanbacteria bacterium CG22_combo_CG10-13_8_21_14_all_38_20]PJC30855.1 MAG: hypothetical protein CO050_04795 [Candidatus Roizmanbacteria bacterium CG_4_9_14_0_2_um_filter_38_17]